MRILLDGDGHFSLDSASSTAFHKLCRWTPASECTYIVSTEEIFFLFEIYCQYSYVWDWLVTGTIIYGNVLKRGFLTCKTASASPLRIEKFQPIFLHKKGWRIEAWFNWYTTEFSSCAKNSSSFKSQKNVIFCCERFSTACWYHFVSFFADSRGGLHI